MSHEPARLNVDLDRDLHDRLNRCVPWGVKAVVIRSLVTLLVEAVERDGPLILGAVMAKDVSLTIKDTSNESS